MKAKFSLYKQKVLNMGRPAPVRIVGLYWKQKYQCELKLQIDNTVVCVYVYNTFTSLREPSSNELTGHVDLGSKPFPTERNQSFLRISTLQEQGKYKVSL